MSGALHYRRAHLLADIGVGITRKVGAQVLDYLLNDVGVAALLLDYLLNDVGVAALFLFHIDLTAFDKSLIQVLFVPGCHFIVSNQKKKGHQGFP
jgi:hypothetical protein